MREMMMMRLMFRLNDDDRQTDNNNMFIRHMAADVWIRGIKKSEYRNSIQTHTHTYALDYCNAVLTGIPLHLARRLQSAMNAAAWLVFVSSKCDHITPLLCQLHCLKAPWWIDYKLVVLVYKYLHGLASSYLADELHYPAESEFRRRLRSALSYELSVSCTRLSTYCDRAFPVAAVQIWNSLQHHITSAPSLPVFCSRLKTYFFELCYQ